MTEKRPDRPIRGSGKMPRPLPTAERMHEILAYDAATGDLTWRKTGRLATTKEGQYLRVFIDERRYRAHRVIWKMMTGNDPPEEIDHWNRGGADNRWANLRLATRQQNTNNRSNPFRPGLTRGISRTAGGKYKAQHWVNGTYKYLGTFATPEEADRAYLAAAKDPFLCTDNTPAYVRESPSSRRKRRKMAAGDWLVVKIS